MPPKFKCCQGLVNMNQELRDQLQRLWQYLSELFHAYLRMQREASMMAAEVRRLREAADRRGGKGGGRGGKGGVAAIGGGGRGGGGGGGALAGGGPY
jgi:uncharacterized membrane protein YgcG